MSESKSNNLIEPVANRVRTLRDAGELNLPDSYSPENALKSAYLILQETQDRNKKPVLESCTKISIQNALLEMIVMGLSPAKRQCAFIARGNKLTCSVQYQGNIVRARRQANLLTVNANVIYENDEFEYYIEPATGRIVVEKHVQRLENRDNEIIGAYATLMFRDDKPPHTEVMTIKEIRQAWMQGDTKGNSPAHKNFPAQMAKKTVITRGLKLYIEGSDDSDLFDAAEPHPEYAVTEGAQEVDSTAEYIDMDEEPEEQSQPALQAKQPAESPTKEAPKKEPAPAKRQEPEAPTIFGDVGKPPPPPKGRKSNGTKAPF